MRNRTFRDERDVSEWSATRNLSLGGLFHRGGITPDKSSSLNVVQGGRKRG